MKVEDLIGIALDEMIAEIEGIEPHSEAYWRYSPSECDEEAGPIIDREKISALWRPERGVWWACSGGQDPCNDETEGQDGPTRLVAAMRAHLAYCWSKI
jgi:hypothetical protein